MPESRQPAGEHGAAIDSLLLLDSIIRHPDGLEAGLRILAMDRARNREACLAWGLDGEDHPVALYVSCDAAEPHGLGITLTHLIQRFSESRTAVTEESVGTSIPPRFLVVAAGFPDGPLDLPSGWAVEFLLWRTRAAEIPGEVFIEFVRADEPGGVQDREVMEPPTVRLCAEEVESLIGSGPPAPAGARE